MFGFVQGKEKESSARIKMFMTIMDSMTDKELDCPNPKVLQEQSRVMRLARGAGCNPYCVLELLGMHPPQHEPVLTKVKTSIGPQECIVVACSSLLHITYYHCMKQDL